MLLCMMVVQLESPPSIGCCASFKFDVFWAGLATRTVQSAAREVGSRRQEAGGKGLRPGGRWASGRGVPELPWVSAGRLDEVSNNRLEKTPWVSRRTSTAFTERNSATKSGRRFSGSENERLLLYSAPVSHYHTPAGSSWPTHDVTLAENWQGPLNQRCARKSGLACVWRARASRLTRARAYQRLPTP